MFDNKKTEQKPRMVAKGEKSQHEFSEYLLSVIRPYRADVITIT